MGDTHIQKKLVNFHVARKVHHAVRVLERLTALVGALKMTVRHVQRFVGESERPQTVIPLVEELQPQPYAGAHVRVRGLARNVHERHEESEDRGQRVQAVAALILREKQRLDGLAPYAAFPRGQAAIPGTLLSHAAGVLFRPRLGFLSFPR